MILGFGDLYNDNYVLLNLISLIKFNGERVKKGSKPYGCVIQEDESTRKEFYYLE